MSLTGHVEVNFTVRDPARSAAWYATLLRMEIVYDFTGADGQMRYISLVEPISGLRLCCVGHATNSGEPFSEFRTGLDHIELMVARRADLDDWVVRLDELGIVHSGVKELDYTPNAMVTFRDPDGIQLEFFWRAVQHQDA